MTIDQLFEQIEDQPIEGGCDRCNAWQILFRNPDGTYVLQIAHDDWCAQLKTARSEVR